MAGEWRQAVAQKQQQKESGVVANDQPEGWRQSVEKRSIQRQQQEPSAPKSDKEKPGFFRDLVTGESRKTEQSENTPSLADVGINNLLGSVSPMRAAKASAAIATTFDPAGIFNIIEAATDEPVTLDRDEKGNFYINVGGDGNQRRVIVNPPGLDKTDVIQGGATAAAFTPAGRFGAGAATFKDAALGVGLGSAGTQALVSHGQNLAGRDASIGTMAGETALAGLTGALSEALIASLGNAFKDIVKGRMPVTDDIVSVYQEAAAKVGIDPKTITRDQVKRINKNLDESLGNNLDAVAGETEFPQIPLTKGERTGKTRQLLKEDDFRSGALGETAQERMIDFNTRQAQGARSEADKLQVQLGQGDNALAPGTNQPSVQRPHITSSAETGDVLTSGVRQAEDQARAVVNDAFEQIGDASLKPDALVGMLDATEQVLDNIEYNVVEGLTPGTIGFQGKISRIKASLSDAENEISSVHINQMNGIRKSLGSLVRNTQGEDRRNLSAMLNNMDDWIDNAVAKGLIDGDQSSIQALRDANSTFSRYAKLFRKDKKRDRLGNLPEDRSGKLIEKIVAQDPTATQVVDAIFGASKISNKGAANMVNRFEKILGRDSEGFSALKQEAFRRIMHLNNAQRTVDGSLQSIEVISGQNSLNNFRKIMSQNRDAMKVLFTDDEISKMQRFFQQVKRSQPDLSQTRSRQNPSGTGQAIKRLMSNPLRAFMPGASLELTSIGVGLTRNARASKAATQAIRPFKGVVKAGNIRPVATGAAISAAEENKQR